MSTIRVNGIQDTNGVERYLARAWVNFNGTGTVAIRASGNVSSITDNNTGDYTVNFTTAMPDANFARLATVSGISGQANMCVVGTDRYNTTLNTATTTTTRLYCYINNTAQDPEFVSFAAFR